MLSASASSALAFDMALFLAPLPLEIALTSLPGKGFSRDGLSLFLAVLKPLYVYIASRFSDPDDASYFPFTLPFFLDLKEDATDDFMSSSSALFCSACSLMNSLFMSYSYFRLPTISFLRKKFSFNN